MMRPTVTHNERTGDPLYVDVYRREPGGPVSDTPLRTYCLQPGEARTLEVHPGQVLVLRDDPPRRPGEEVPHA